MNKTKRREVVSKLLLNAEELAGELSCGIASARKFGEEAGAVVTLGRRKLYNREKIKEELYRRAC